MNRLLALLLFASLIACDKGGDAPPSVTPTKTETPAPTKSNMPKAPASIPQKYVTMLENTWPKVKELGETFETQYKKAQESRGRDKDAVDAASQTFRELSDLWSEVAYAAQDDSEEVMAKWEKYISSYDKKVRKWTNMSKGMKEFSRVK